METLPVHDQDHNGCQRLGNNDGGGGVDLKDIDQQDAADNDNDNGQHSREQAGHILFLEGHLGFHFLCAVPASAVLAAGNHHGANQGHDNADGQPRVDGRSQELGGDQLGRCRAAQKDHTDGHVAGHNGQAHHSGQIRGLQDAEAQVSNNKNIAHNAAQQQHHRQQRQGIGRQPGACLRDEPGAELCVAAGRIHQCAKHCAGQERQQHILHEAGGDHGEHGEIAELEAVCVSDCHDGRGNQCADDWAQALVAQNDECDDGYDDEQKRQRDTGHG